jgi:thiol-disulfide isomerase/thioredoxin
MNVQLDPQMVRMPELAPGDWLNVEHPLTKDALRGRAVLIDFWDYACINCLRTFPYLVKWYERYAAAGLVVIGIHAPEFRFARSRVQVEGAVAAFDLRYPILLDNEYQNWDRFANRAWPTKYLVDAEGYIRYRQQGEGYYQETEQAIQALLRQRDPDVRLPALLPLLRAEDSPGAVCYRATPELYAGYRRGSLGNPEGYAADNPLAYRMPPRLARTQPNFYAGGIWRAGAESFVFAGQDGGRLIVPYSALRANAVLSPSGDPVELMLDLRSPEHPPLVEVRQDGEPLRALNAGPDITFGEDGTSIVAVTRPRLYELVRNPDFGTHELELIFHAGGLAVYTFTFTSCIMRGK